MSIKYKDDSLLIDGIDVGENLNTKRKALSFDVFFLDVFTISSGDASELFNRFDYASSIGFIKVEKGANFKVNDAANFGLNLFLYTSPEQYGYTGSMVTVTSNYTIESTYYVRIRLFKKNRENITDISIFDGKYTFTGYYYENTDLRLKLCSRRIANSVGSQYYCNAEYFGKQNVSSLYAAYDSLMAEYPDFITKKVIGKDASNSYDIVAYTIDAHNYKKASSARRSLKIVLMSNIHGSEWEAASSDFVFAKELCEKKDTDDTMRLLWDNCVFVIIPTCNPWGLQNTNRCNSNGVNLNRNFPADWIFYDEEPFGYNYAGEAPADQEETKLLVSFISQHRDAFIMINRHTSGGLKKSETNRQYGYATSSFVTDNDVTAAAAKEIDGIIKRNNLWFYEDDAELRHIPLFVNQSLTNHGCMDAYFNSKGIHGFIFEFGQYNFADYGYPNMNAENVQKIDVTITANLFKSYVIENAYILSSTERDNIVYNKQNN